MIIFSIFCIWMFIVIMSRFIFGKWFNHISMYSSIWGGTLSLFELRLINYYQIELETWVIIIATWILFLIGSLTVTAARFTVKDDYSKTALVLNPLDSKKMLSRLKNTLWVLNIAIAFSAVYDLYLVSKIFGSISNAFLLGNLLYRYHITEGLPGSIPGLDSLAFIAAMLAGSYTALKGKITFVAILPIITVIVVGFAKMGRADILMASLLFVIGYFLTPRKQNSMLKKIDFKFRRFAMLFVVFAIIIGGAEFIRSTRKVHEQFAGTTKALGKLNDANVITPSVYLYFSSQIGVLNQYLKHGDENSPFGGHTFLPIYRWLENIGFEIHAKPFQAWYRTPVRTNTGTYLRELHGDFGIIGLLIGPYLLGLFSSIFWYRIEDYGKYKDISITAFFYVIIGMSFFVMATRQGQLIVYIITALGISYFLDKSSTEEKDKII